MPFSRGSFRPRDWTLVSCIAGVFFTIWAIRLALIRKSNFLIKYLSKYFGFGVHGHCKQAVWLIQNSVLISNHPNSKSHILTLLFPTMLIDFHVNIPMKLENIRKDERKESGWVEGLNCWFCDVWMKQIIIRWLSVGFSSESNQLSSISFLWTVLSCSVWNLIQLRLTLFSFILSLELLVSLTLVKLNGLGGTDEFCPGKNLIKIAAIYWKVY